MFTVIIFYRVNVTFITRQRERVDVRGKIGDNVMYLAHRYNIELEGKYVLCII